MALENCKPENVFRFFEEICQIPHGSGNEEALSNHIVEFAKERDLWCHRDEALNVVIKKPGTSGYENAPPVVIQGHLDMVCVKMSNEYPHDFLKDPIRVYADGDFIKAKGTSLGADNGVAVAIAMALLDSGEDVAHPPIEAVFTTNEEVGMNGAAVLDPNLLDGKIFINIDSEEEGIFCASCAGGIRVIYRLLIKEVSIPGGFNARTVKISGLKGGHSGMMIHKERANANVLLGRLLYKLDEKFDIYISDISGGLADNAIAAVSECTLLFKEEESAQVFSLIDEMERIFQNEFRYSEEGIKISVESAKTPDKAFSKELTSSVIATLRLVPNGVQSKSAAKENLVESSNNIGVVCVNDGAVEMIFALRSSVETRKIAMLEQIHIIGRITGAVISTKGDYPEWEYNPDSKIRKLFMDTYNEMFTDRKPAEEEAIHAGLECGWFAKKLKTSELVSLGPLHFDVHSVNERLSISSTERTWELIKAVLAKMR